MRLTWHPLPISSLLLIAIAGTSLPTFSSGQTWSDSGVVVTASLGLKSGLKVVPDPRGGVFVGWLAERPETASNLPEAFVSHIRSDGSLAEGWPIDGLQASISSGEVFPLHMVVDGSGGLALFWADEGEESGEFFNRVFMHRFDDFGVGHPAFPSGGLRLAPFDQRGLGDAKRSDDGCYFVVGGWVGPTGSGSDGGILLTKVDSLGITAAGWPAEGVVLCDEPGTQSRSTLISDGTGGMIVLWRDLRNGIDARLYGARVSASGAIDADWPAEGRDLGLLPTSGPGFTAVADSAGFIVAIEPQRLLAFDFDGLLRPDWSPLAFTQDAGPDGPRDLFHRPRQSDRGTYLSWIRRRYLGGAIFEDQRMLSLLTTQGASVAPWPDTGLVLSRSVSSSLFLPLVIQPSPSGLYLIIGDRDENGDDYWRGGLLSPDLTWAPGWPPGGREVSRFLAGGPSTIASDGSLYHAFTYSDPFSATQGIRLFKMGVDGPVATLASVASAEVVGDEARLEWLVVDPPVSPLRVERSRDGTAWEDAGLAEVGATDRVRFEESGLVPGERRAYRLAWSEAGGRVTAGLVWVKRASSGGLRLASARHPTGVERLELRLIAESSDPIDVQVLDVQGRVRARRTIARTESAERALTLPTDAWATGLYFVRIAQGETTIRSRVTLLR